MRCALKLCHSLVDGVKEVVSSKDESQLKPLVLKSEARSSEEGMEHGQRCEEMRVPGHGEL